MPAQSRAEQSRGSGLGECATACQPVWLGLRDGNVFLWVKPVQKLHVELLPKSKL